MERRRRRDFLIHSYHLLLRIRLRGGRGGLQRGLVVVGTPTGTSTATSTSTVISTTLPTLTTHFKSDHLAPSCPKSQIWRRVVSMMRDGSWLGDPRHLRRMKMRGKGKRRRRGSPKEK